MGRGNAATAVWRTAAPQWAAQRQAHDAVHIVRTTQAHAVLFFQHVDELVEHHIHRTL